MGAFITTAAASLAAKELLKQSVIDIYEYCKIHIGRDLNQWTTERQIRTLYQRIAQVRKVKTIWQVDKTVDLGVFYCDSHVLVNKIRKRITRLTDFGIDDNLLIQGIAGQGKSIFLRYLCSVELNSAQRIPIFLELRRITSDSSLMDRIKISLLNLDLTVDDHLFHTLAASGKILLLMDAFDEVPDDLKVKVLSDIEDLAARHKSLRIIITSRPGHNIHMSTHFTVISLDNLKGGEYAQVIRKLSRGQEWAQTLIDHIEKKAIHIKDLLCTPLMVTLLVLSYKSYQQLPTKLSEFYDSLFQTLLQRHDGTKPGFTRPRGCALDDNEYRQAFETQCILAKKLGQQSFSVRMFVEITKKALTECGFRVSASAFVDDIIKITCLIIRDGEECRFIHKTVQEYYTASFIQKKPQAWASEFYSRLLIGEASLSFEQELEFLSEIDLYRYNRFFCLPAILNLFKITDHDLDNKNISMKMESLSEMFDSMYITFSRLGLKGDHTGIHLYSNQCRSYILLLFTRDILANNPFMLLGKEAKEISEKHPELLLRTSKITSTFKEKSDSNILSIRLAIEAGGMPSLVEAAKKEFTKYIEKANSIKTQLLKEENPSLLDGLI